MTESRTLPYAEDAERAVVGAALLYPDAALPLVGDLPPVDFHHPTLAAVWEAIRDLASASRPVDAITVAERMRAADTFGKLRAFGHDAYFADLMAGVVTADNVAFHADIVRRKATRRRLIETSQAIAAEGYQDGDDGAFIASAEASIAAVCAGGRPRTGAQPIADVLRAAIHEIEAAHNRGGGLVGIPSTFARLDELCCGFQVGDQFVLAGRPSMGKSALLVDFIEAAAVAGNPCFIASLEMTSVALVKRRISARSGVNGWCVRRGVLNVEDWKAITVAASGLATLPITLDDKSKTLSAVLAAIRLWRAKQPPGLRARPGILAVDYLQLLEHDGRRDANREQQVSDASRAFKLLAGELDCTALVLSQLNRGVESRDEKRPRLSDLRESGAIEQNADVIAFIYRDEVYHPESEDKGIAEIIVEKQRNGPTGMVRLGWDAPRTSFYDLADDAPGADARPRKRRGRKQPAVQYDDDPRFNGHAPTPEDA